ncbi:MAG: hypothetical protein K0S09_3237 [Sphingobacteriaceae bacterium]|jgi:hypothetical protein|nr:hypothetical protein [Sphingobacteriaceae bacterium]
MKAIEVKALSDYKIAISFEDGTKGETDLSQLVEQGIFRELKDTTKFANVYTTGYSIAWNDELEIDALTIYAELLNRNPEEILKSA